MTTTDARLSFAFEFRKYQRMMLTHLADRVDSPGQDERFHLVSPPGSGKTVLGIELIARLGEPAVVFAPTSTIQHQWVDKVEMFTDSREQRDALVSTDPTALSHVNVFTYQLISVPAADRGLLDDAAEKAWLLEILERDPEVTTEQARERIANMQAANRDAHRREVRKRANRLRRDLLREPHPNVEQFLHPNAVELIDNLVAAGVRTVVLDECHHLLDYWAIVLSALIARIDKPRVIGLTATLPSVDDDNEYENYMGLLGEVDFEVPTPAVVKEGDLAPYRGLAVFVSPSPEEQSYLNEARQLFDQAVADATSGDAFMAYLTDGLFGNGDDPHSRWMESLTRNYPLAVAAAATLRNRGGVPPAQLPLPSEASSEPDFNDMLAVVERYALDHLKLSPDPQDHRRLALLKTAIKPFGYTLTERGLRQARSPGDLMLTYSRAKASATATILGREHQELGDRLRAVVVTDYESTGFSFPGEQLELQRGSARRVFFDLVHHPESHHLDPVLVTGKTLWMDADRAEKRVKIFNDWLQSHDVNAECTIGTSKHPGIVEILGTGRDWGSATYVRMVTAALESGVLKCLVGTRGLFAEGWDALSLNTFVDLTSVTSSTTTQQLRGRALRVDPSWAEKVAHQWDVVCVDPEEATGDVDFNRLRARHRHLWGVLPDYSRTPPELVGKVVRGVNHVDPVLAFLSREPGPRHRALRDATERALAQIPRRAVSRSWWRIGSAYRNFEYRASQVVAPQLTIRTGYTVQQSLRAMLAKFRVALIAGPVALVLGLISQAALLPSIPLQWMAVISLVIALGGLAVALPQAIKIARETLRADHPDTVLLDIALAVFGALHELRMISRALSPDSVVVTETLSLTYVVALENAPAEDQEIFAAAVGEALAPIQSQRYLITRREAQLPEVWLRPMWMVVRRLMRVDGLNRTTTHPVPEILGRRKERAQVYQQHWERMVSGGELIYTKTPDGWRRLLEARALRQPQADASPYDYWE